MKVTRTLPFRPLCRLLPTRLAGLSITLLKATALELAILAGHLLLYPSGILPERRLPLALPRHPSAYVPVDIEDVETGTAEENPPTEPAEASAPTGADTARLPAPDKPPVLLLHGFIDNRSVFVLLRRSLAQHGRQHVESLNYSPLTCDIRAAAALLARHVEEVCERSGRDRVDIVGHSLGGLIARYYVQRLGGDTRVRTLVTLGTPHGGTHVAPLADAHPIVRQMRPGSSLVEELKRPAPGCRTRFVSFWSDLDQLMLPLETACVDHADLLAQNVRVTGIGHLALPVHPAVATGIRQALDAEPAEGAHAAAKTGGGLTVA
ncbi:lipase family alpha/beta hydrolase [Streptomyces endophyticus]|uniref:Alpha/beta fold hydrolase n=1 Tax=Streptomyces endophyticus TaxID=714166 RepID=A0ABU6EYN1_9ACTN|nr:alpha/beta fold hydrolase [Streptomyces endophyticus]MEB8336724.1 alpha/beta fold hydrolase [Streptomyces endophyticus]